MIFVTVGSDLPFDRLVRVVDEWAAKNGRSDVFAQIGDTEYRPGHIACSKFVTPAEYAQHIATASTIISHAGMGTILSALRAERPILVMPRLVAHREVRNHHQTATAQRLVEVGKVHVAFDEAELRAKLDRLDELKASQPIGPYAGEDLLGALRDFIAGSQGRK